MFGCFLFCLFVFESWSGYGVQADLELIVLPQPFKCITMPDSSNLIFFISVLMNGTQGFGVLRKCSIISLDFLLHLGSEIDTIFKVEKSCVLFFCFLRQGIFVAP